MTPKDTKRVGGEGKTGPWWSPEGGSRAGPSSEVGPSRTSDDITLDHLQRHREATREDQEPRSGGARLKDASVALPLAAKPARMDSVTLGLFLSSE